MADQPRPREPERDARTGRSAAYQRIQHQQAWVEQQLRIAQERGDFDNLPGYGKPLDLSGHHDPDWWLKKLVERENLHVLPPSVQLRKEDAELDHRLDAHATEEQVRRTVADFNERVRHALYTTHGGPPIVTPQRDVDTEVERWRERREVRRARPRPRDRDPGETPAPRRRWWRRR